VAFIIELGHSRIRIFTFAVSKLPGLAPNKLATKDEKLAVVQRKSEPQNQYKG